MLTLMSYVAALLYLAPLVLVLAARSRRDRSLWEIALDIPLIAAVDLLFILLATRLFTLESAILLSRVVGLTVGIAGVVVTKHRGQLAWPTALTPRVIAITMTSALASLLLSMSLSRVCNNADRAWHIPLVSSLQGQRIPFANVYEPSRTLGYHYTGDVHAAVFQTLSGRVLHASFALSLAHDIAFALTGAAIALFVLWMRHRHAFSVLFVTLGTLLAGPLTLFRGDRGRPGGGYNFINYLKLSYRPHVCLAGLLLVGVLGALLVNLRESRSTDKEPPFRRTIPAILACTALLAVTDEASIGVLGLAMGLTWLAAPQLVHPKRLPGMLIFAGLATAFIVPNVLFVGALAPSNPDHSITWVALRSPGYLNPPLPLSQSRGRWMLLFDFAPMLLALLGGVLCALQNRVSERVVSVSFYAVLLVISAVTLTCMDVDHLPIENHRFVTAAMLVFPLLGAFWLSPPPASAPGVRFVGDALAPALLIGAVGLSAASTIEWRTSSAMPKCVKPSKYRSRHDFFKTNCVADTGATLGEVPVPTYMESGIFYIHAGCHPVFATGPRANHWALKIGLSQVGEPSLRELHNEMIGPEDSLQVICPATETKTSDAVCRHARTEGKCTPLGEKTTSCEVSAAERVALLPVMAEEAKKAQERKKKQKQQKKK